MHSSRRKAFTVVIALNMGCAGPVTYYRADVSYTPGISQRRVAQVVAHTLQSHGYAIKASSEFTGSITTDWRNSTNIGKRVLDGKKRRDLLTISLSDSSATLRGESQVKSGVGLVTALVVVVVIIAAIVAIASLSDDDDDEENEDQHGGKKSRRRGGGGGIHMPHGGGGGGDSSGDGWRPESDIPAPLRDEWASIAHTVNSRLAGVSVGDDPEFTSSPGAVRVTYGSAPIDEAAFDSTRGPMAIAVTPLAAEGINPQEARVLTDRLRGELLDLKPYTVVERDKMTEILQEQGFAQSELCGTDECAVEIGRLVGVEGMVGGTVGKLGGTYTVTIRLIDVESGEILRRATEDCACKVDDLLLTMRRVARTLAGHSAGR